MGIESVNMDKALTSESYAAQCIRSGKLSGSQRSQLAAKWGADKIKLWEAVDSTKYKIEDDDWNAAKTEGRKTAEEKTGHDGSKQGKLRVAGDAAGAIANGAMALFGAKIGKKILSKGIVGKGMGVFRASDAYNKNNPITKKAAQTPEKDYSDIATVIIGAAEATNYHLNKPNEDQQKALMELYDAEKGSGGLLVDGQNRLEEAQILMEEATEETTKLTDESQEINEDANDSIEDDKTNFDFFRKQYEYLKAKAQSGEALTPDEKQLIQKLAPLMEEAKTNITATQEDAADGLDQNYEAILGYEGDYNEGAETIAEVQGLTDFAEGFDSDTRTTEYIEGVSLGITGATTGLAAARLATKGGLSLGATLAFAAMGAVAAVRLGLGSKEQFDWAGLAGQEVHYREATQDLGGETQEVYDTELDNFAGNMDIIDDMELEVPTDLETPEAAVIPEEGDGADINPLAAGAAGVDDEGDGEGNGGLENDENYTNVMGKGSDYTDILTGKSKRGANDKLVTDANGKVILTSTYANAIVSVTGDETGKGYDKEQIPAIIAKVLGDPFTEEVITKVKNGGSVDSEFAAKLVKTKSGKEAGEEIVDNTEAATKKAKDVIDFYWPIFEKAASGWVRG